MPFLLCDIHLNLFSKINELDKSITLSQSCYVRELKKCKQTFRNQRRVCLWTFVKNGSQSLCHRCLWYGGFPRRPGSPEQGIQGIANDRQQQIVSVSNPVFWQVNATLRNPNDEKKTGWLKKLENAEGNLDFFAGDLDTPGSFKNALNGCEAVVVCALPESPKSVKTLDLFFIRLW